MAKKRIFFDECCAEDGLRECFPAKTHFFIAKDLGVRGKEDQSVIDKAVEKKCLIITVNKDFVDYYRSHPYRKGGKITFFYGLIFLKQSKSMTRRKQLAVALKRIAWEETRQHDDLIIVSAQGKTKHERLCHRECAEAFPSDMKDWD